MASLYNFSEHNLAEVGNQSKPAQTERLHLEVDASNPQDPKIKIRQQSWSAGMGWFTQKTITLDVEQAAELLPDLQATLNNAKLTRSQSQRTKTPQKANLPQDEANLIEFPVERRKSASNQPAKAMVDTTEAIVVQFKARNPH